MSLQITVQSTDADIHIVRAITSYYYDDDDDQSFSFIFVSSLFECLFVHVV